MQALLDQVNSLIASTWFWVLVALVAMYFLTCYTKESFKDQEALEGTLDLQTGNYKDKKKTVVPIH